MNAAKGRIGLAAALLSVVFCIPASPLRSGEVETVRFGVVMSLTGDFATSGNTYLTGIKLRLEDFNRDANEHGIRLEMLVRDDESDADTAVRHARELLDGEKVAGIIGSNSTDVTLALVPTVRERGALLISPSATSWELGAGIGGTFRAVFDDRFQGRALARFVRRNLGMTRAAILANERYDYSRSISAAFVSAFEELGGEIVVVELYNRVLEDPDYDFLPHLEKVKAHNPQAVLLPSYPEDVIMAVQQSLQLNLRTVFCGGDAWDKDSILLESGNNLANSYYIGVLNENTGTPQMRHFMELLNKSNDVYAEPSSALGYDVLSLFIEALRRRDGGVSLRDALYGLKDFPLVTGNISIDRVRGTVKEAYIIRIMRKGDVFAKLVVDTINPGE